MTQPTDPKEEVCRHELDALAESMLAAMPNDVREAVLRLGYERLLKERQPPAGPSEASALPGMEALLREARDWLEEHPPECQCDSGPVESAVCPYHDFRGLCICIDAALARRAAPTGQQEALVQARDCIRAGRDLDAGLHPGWCGWAHRQIQRIDASLAAAPPSAPQEGLFKEGLAAIDTLKSLSVMLGWMNVPPREVLERSINALKARAAARPPSAEKPAADVCPRCGACNCMSIYSSGPCFKHAQPPPSPAVDAAPIEGRGRCGNCGELYTSPFGCPACSGEDDHEHTFDAQFLCTICGQCALDLAGAAAPPAPPIPPAVTERLQCDAALVKTLFVEDAPEPDMNDPDHDAVVLKEGTAPARGMASWAEDGLEWAAWPWGQPVDLIVAGDTAGAIRWFKKEMDDLSESAEARELAIYKLSQSLGCKHADRCQMEHDTLQCIWDRVAALSTLLSDALRELGGIGGATVFSCTAGQADVLERMRVFLTRDGVGPSPHDPPGHPAPFVEEQQSQSPTPTETARALNEENK